MQLYKFYMVGETPSKQRSGKIESPQSQARRGGCGSLVSITVAPQLTSPLDWAYQSDQAPSAKPARQTIFRLLVSESREGMWLFSRTGPSGFSASSTAEEVTQGIDGSGLTAIVTGDRFLSLSLFFIQPPAKTGFRFSSIFVFCAFM